MWHNNDFNLLSINVRGIRTFEKRKAVFSWLVNSDADIFFLQETYSTRDIEISGENNGRAKCSSRMAAIIAEGLVRDNLDFKIHSTNVNSQGRYIFLEAYIQDLPYFILNILRSK